MKLYQRMYKKIEMLFGYIIYMDAAPYTPACTNLWLASEAQIGHIPQVCIYSGRHRANQTSCALSLILV